MKTQILRSGRFSTKGRITWSSLKIFNQCCLDIRVTSVIICKSGSCVSALHLPAYRDGFGVFLGVEYRLPERPVLLCHYG